MLFLSSADNWQETKGRTLEEIGTLFGDDAHVASHWYDLSELEREKIAREAMQSTKDKTFAEAATHDEFGSE